ncbi:hypothetical protein J2X54_000187 [Duganella sp. 3397]|uniref:hypothetical protein n=1 Tax=Duganella sp. 3397 TaxID=2817732 RepID=UPI002865774A|nr:hypothetical protein [Duganella sp. 3397]MDR7047752.1 hypothetical protein [Duganella sp. 3397]
MRNWDDFIAIEAGKICNISEAEFTDLLKQNAATSKLLGASLDLMLNNLSTPELRNGITHQVVRNDPVQREWEATFSAVNMVGPVIISLAMQGFYAAAICLLRHELEGVAQLKHILDGRRSKKYAPSISHLEERMRKWYPALSESAHLSSDFAASMQAPLLGNPDNLALLPHGNSMLPVYNKKIAEEVIGIHIEIRKELIKRVDEHLERIGIKIPDAGAGTVITN